MNVSVNVEEVFDDIVRRFGSSQVLQSGPGSVVMWVLRPEYHIYASVYTHVLIIGLIEREFCGLL